MNCPNCRTAVPDDAVICDTCNYIIDAGFLGDGITNQPSSVTVAPPVQDDGKTRVRAMPAATSPERIERVDAPPPEETYQSDEERRRSLSVVAAVPSSVNESIYTLSEQYKALPMSERIATTAAWIFLISLGLPWRWTQADDTVIGFMAGAWPLGFVVLYVAVVAYIRRLPQMRPYKGPFIAGMALASALVVLGNLFYVINSIGHETVHVAGYPHEVWTRYPHIGAGIGLVSAIVMLMGSLLAFINRDHLPDA